MKYRGVPLQSITNALDHDDVLTCAELEDEVVRIMKRKFSIDPEELREQLSAVLGNCVRVVVSGRVSGVCRDPKDDFILECAANGNAQLIVTGDEDLLSLVLYGEIEIVTPRQYLNRAQNESRRS